VLENISISSESRVGGLAGRLWDGGTIRNTHIQDTGRIYGVFVIGGLVGENRRTIEDSSVSGILIESSGGQTGGFVGGNGGIINRSFVTAKILSEGPCPCSSGKKYKKCCLKKE